MPACRTLGGMRQNQSRCRLLRLHLRLGRGADVVADRADAQHIFARVEAVLADRTAGRVAQTVENQIRELRQVAGWRGWDVVEVYSNTGISGAKGRNGRAWS